MGEVRVRDVRTDGLTAKLVTKPVVGRDHVLRHVQSLYVTDGTRLWTRSPSNASRASRTCWPGCRTLRTTATAAPDREAEVTSAGDLRLTHPSAEGPEFFDARADTTQELAAFALAADPRGYGNPDEGWSHLVASTAVEATPAPGAPEDLHVFAVRHGVRRVFDPGFTRTPEGLSVRTGGVHRRDR